MKRLTVLFALGILILIAHSGWAKVESCCVGTRGNVDYSAEDAVDIADLVYLVDYMFNGGSTPPCYEEANIDGAGSIDIADLVYLVDYMFTGGPAPGDCPPDVVVPVIQPLAIGNSWTTYVTEYLESGLPISEYFAVGEVVGDSTIADTTWYHMAGSTGGVDTSLWTNKEDGAWMWTDSAGQPQALMMKYPATAGESYPVYAVTVTVESTSTSITVPAGTFECYYYRAHIPIFGTVGKIWAAPDVGVVRAEEYGLGFFTTYLSRRVELVEYSLVVSGPQ